MIKPLKRGNTKLTCTVKVPTTGETIVKTAYIMVADQNGNFDELVEDDNAPEILNIQINEYAIKVEARDNESGLAEKAYSLDGKIWQISNEFNVSKAGKYTIHVRDNAENITTKPVEVVAAKEDEKTEKEDKADEEKTPAKNEKENNNSKNEDNKTSTETKNVEKTEDKTQAKTIISQTGATFPIIALIFVSIIGFVGYKKFKKVNY